MNLIRTSFYTSISTVITYITGFVLTKVVAVKIGPSGLAYVGQYQNSIAILAMLATFSINNGVIKYLSQYKDEPKEQQRIITTGISIILTASLLISLIVMASSGLLSSSIFKTKNFWLVYFLYGMFLSLSSLNTLFAAILNGLKKIKQLTIVNIITSVLGLLFTTLLALTSGVKGVLIAGNFTAIVVFVVNIFFLQKSGDYKYKPQFKKWDITIVKKLCAFTIMGVVSALVQPFTQILIRKKIISNFSLLDAGCWQAVTKISDYYLAFITTVLTVYYLPKLSELKSKMEIRSEITNGYKIILPAVGILAWGIWLGRKWVVQLLFTEEFMPMLPLFKFQLLGDFLKVGSWLIAFLMLSKSLTKTFVISEILFSISLVLLSNFFIDTYGVIGATYAFSINYGLYWMVMWFLMKKYIS